MKGRFNIPMTEYYIEGEGPIELEYAETICDSWLKEHNFTFKKYTLIYKTFTFKVTYNTPPEFQVDSSIEI